MLDSAKGWAATIRFNERVLKQFQEFYNRPDTFSLGICNGCQLQALLGWVPATASADGGVAAQLPDLQQPRFVHNTSGRWVRATFDRVVAAWVQSCCGSNSNRFAAHCFPSVAVAVLPGQLSHAGLKNCCYTV